MVTHELPFVHLMKTPLNYYVYDVNTNTIIRIGASIFAYLAELLDGKNPDCSATAEAKQSYLNMRSNGFFSSTRPAFIEHGQSSFLEYHLNENIKQMTLQVTQECNFRCSYCSYSVKDTMSQRKHSSKRMSFDTATRAIDFLVSHSRNQNEVVIGFYGGEPLLEIDMVKEIVKYAEKQFYGKELSFTMTTNGYLLTKEMVRFFSNYNFNITISLDGTSEIHDRSRKLASNGGKTFDAIKKNLYEIKKEHPDFFKKILLNIVIDPRYPCNPLHAFFDDDPCFNDLQINPTLIDDFFSTEKTIPSDAFIKEDSQHRFKAYLSFTGRYPRSKASKISLHSILSDYTKLKEALDPASELFLIMAHGGPCIPGQQRLFVNVDGIFYPCERVSETSDAMKIGNLWDGFDIKKAQKILNIGQLTEEDCKNCWAIRHCLICARTCDNNGNLCADLKRSQCERIKQTIESQFKDYLLLCDYDISLNRILMEG